MVVSRKFSWSKPGDFLSSRFKVAGDLIVALVHKKGIVVVYHTTSGNGNISLRKNLVIKYDKKSKNLDFTDAGVQIFKKDVLKLIPPCKIISLEEEIFPKLMKKKQLAAYVTKEKFYDIGTHEGLKIIKGVLK